jgi:hypothetical protein
VWLPWSTDGAVFFSKDRGDTWHRAAGVIATPPPAWGSQRYLAADTVLPSTFYIYQVSFTMMISMHPPRPPPWFEVTEAGRAPLADRRARAWGACGGAATGDRPGPQPPAPCPPRPCPPSDSCWRLQAWAGSCGGQAGQTETVPGEQIYRSSDGGGSWQQVRLSVCRKANRRALWRSH